MKVRRWAAIAITFAVIVAILSIGILWAFERNECALGQVVAKAPLVTPVGFMNIPYGGYATTTISPNKFSFGSGNLQFVTQPTYPDSVPGGDSILPNSIMPWWPGGLVHVSFNWSMYSVQNETEFTSAPVSHCTAGYVAAPDSSIGGGGEVYVPLPNNTTNLNEPTTLEGVPGMQFDNGFHSPNYGNIYTNGLTINKTIDFWGWASIPLNVTLPVNGHNVTAHGYLSWEGCCGLPTLSYTFPSTSNGYWEVYSFAGANTLGALAFQWENTTKAA